MAGTGERYFVRRKTGEPVGPFSELVITTMLKRGELDGSEEISRDRATWVSVRTLAGPAQPGQKPDNKPADEPAEAAASSSWGERDLGELGELSLGTLDDHGNGATAPPQPTAPAAGPSSLDILDLDGLQLAPLDLDHTGYEAKGKDPAPPPAAAAEPPSKPQLTPLAPEEPADNRPTDLGFDIPVVAQDRANDGGVPDRPAGLRSLDSSGPLSMSGAFAGDPADENLGAVPLTDLSVPSTSLPPLGGARPGETGADGRPNTAPALAPIRPRTMTAAKPRMEAPPKVPRKKLLIGAAAVLVMGAGTAAFFVFELGDLLTREPEAASVIGDDAAAIAGDRFPAYERAAKRLLEAVETRPKSVRLRAAAAELLASSVVLRRAERTRLGKAESALTDAAAHIKKGAPTPAEVVRARAWVALGKGKPREAVKLLDEGGGSAAAGPQAKLLAAWIELGQRKNPAAEKLFRQGMAEHPDHLAFAVGLARAQEEAGKPEAAVSFAQAAKLANEAKDGKQNGGHFAAALGLARVGDFATGARLQLVNKVIAEQGKDASRAELADAYALSSRLSRLLGKPADAAAAIESALAKDPASPAALVAAGELALDDGRLREAVAKFKQAAPGAPALPVAVPTRDLRFAAAAVLIEEGREQDGLALLPPPPTPGGKGNADVDPRGAFWRGRAAELKSPPDAEGATRAYEAALKADPRFVPATLQLAALLMHGKRAAEALAVLRRAETAGAPAAALQVALGQALLTAGDLERAKKTFRDVLAKSPRHAPARMGLASVLEAAGNAAGARAELDGLLAQSPDTPGLRPRLAEVLIKLGDREKALALYQTEVDSGQASLATRLAAARLALELGRIPAALALGEKLVADAPQTPGALLALGKIRRAGGDIAGALTELRRALSFESTPELHYEYAKTLALGGKQEQALTEYEMASTLPLANIERARLLADRNDLERAVPLLEAALKEVPGQGEAWLLLGNAHDRLGAQPKAVAAWRAAAKAGADNAEVHYRLGRWEMDQGQPGPALVHLRQAAAKLGDKVGDKTGGAGKTTWIADCFFQLGFAEKAKGNRSGAIAALKKYLAVAPSDAPSRPEVEQELGRLGSTP